MRLVCGVPDELAIRHEHRHHNRAVLRVRTGTVRHVVNDRVAGLEIRLTTDSRDGRLDTEVHCAREGRHARCLRQHPNLTVIKSNCKVLRLVNDRRIRGAHEHTLHLVRGRSQRMTNDLRGNRVGNRCSARRRPAIFRFIDGVHRATGQYPIQARLPPAAKSEQRYDRPRR